MTDQPVITDQDSDVVALANLSNLLEAIGDPYDHVEDISFALDALNDQDVNPIVLDDIQASAGALYSSVQQLESVAHSLKALGAQFRAQREQYRHEREQALRNLTQLREAIEGMDLSDPSIEAMHEQIEQYVVENLLETWYDDMWERFGDEVFNTTPLEYTEIYSLFNVLTDEAETVPQDDPLWDELRTWIDRAEQATERVDGRER